MDCYVSKDKKIPGESRVFKRVHFCLKWPCEPNLSTDLIHLQIRIFANQRGHLSKTDLANAQQRSIRLTIINPVKNLQDTRKQNLPPGQPDRHLIAVRNGRNDLQRQIVEFDQFIAVMVRGQARQYSDIDGDGRGRAGGTGTP